MFGFTVKLEDLKTTKNKRYRKLKLKSKDIVNLKKSKNKDWLCWLHFGLFISPLREIVKTRNAILFLIKSRNKKNKRVENLISKNKDREQQSTYFITTITLKQREWVLREGERYTVREREREREFDMVKNETINSEQNYLILLARLVLF